MLLCYSRELVLLVPLTDSEVKNSIVKDTCYIRIYKSIFVSTYVTRSYFSFLFVKWVLLHAETQTGFSKDSLRIASIQHLQLILNYEFQNQKLSLPFHSFTKVNIHTVTLLMMEVMSISVSHSEFSFKNISWESSFPKVKRWLRGISSIRENHWTIACFSLEPETDKNIHTRLHSSWVETLKTFLISQWFLHSTKCEWFIIAVFLKFFTFGILSHIY